MPKHVGNTHTDVGGGLNQKSSAGKNSTHRTKTGSKKIRNYDPKNTPTSGGRAPKVSKMYSPSGDNTPSAPV